MCYYPQISAQWLPRIPLSLNSFLRSAEIKSCHVSMVTAGVGTVVYCLEPVAMQEGVMEEVVHWRR